MGEAGDEQHSQAMLGGSDSGNHRHGGGKSDIPGCTSTLSSHSGRRSPGQSSTEDPERNRKIRINGAARQHAPNFEKSDLFGELGWGRQVSFSNG